MSEDKSDKHPDADWFSPVIEFFVKHGMLDVQDEYGLEDIMVALSDNYEPNLDERVITDNFRLREALIHADLKIRSFPGADQSDVEFIREALRSKETVE